MDGRTWRTWQLALVAAIALVVGITFGTEASKSKTTTVTAADVTTQTTPATSPPTTQPAPATTRATVPPTAAPTTVAPVTTAAGPKTHFSGDGSYRVGVDIAAGTYRTPGPKSGRSSCYWERESDFSGSFDSIIANENPTGAGVVTIAASDKGFKSTACQDWAPA